MEALALLATCSLDGADIQTPSAEPCCVICRLPVSVPLSNDHDKKAGMSPSVPRSQQMVEICVRDHSIGIPPAHLERIFDRFHRVDTRFTHEVNGIGLGLAICKRSVQLHGGVIWAESEVGKGSAFHVWLPTDVHT